jgi:biotin synthase-related radical SAM superfamily protein
VPYPGRGEISSLFAVAPVKGQALEERATPSAQSISGSPEMLWILVFTALSDAEAISLRLEML